MDRKLKLKTHNNHYTLIAIFIIATGVLVRLIGFGKIPSGLNQDEAFAAYEAFSLLNYGVDSAGNAFPTYFVSWGSGMNVLQSYLAIPFMWLFGYSETVYRLPSLLCGIATLPVFWLLLKRFWGDKTALIGLGLLSISPWHIMLSRWGLESNLTPAFLLFGIYFLIKGITKNVCLLVSSVFFGLSLYAYSISWITVPILLIIFGIYIIKTNPKIKLRYILAAFIILFIFALPHILFLLINKNIIPEIKTSFITIPKMIYMRDGEISLLNILKPQNWIKLFRILFFQYDTINRNAFPYFGLFYHISLPFFVIGFAKLISQIKSDIKTKKLSGAYFVLGGLLVYMMVSLTIFNLNINKSNGMHLFTLAIISVGICKTLSFAKHKKLAIISLGIAFSICFSSFCVYYFNQGKKEISKDYSGELGKAIELVNENNCQSVAVDYSIPHSQILFYDKTPPNEFKNTVKYETYDSPYLKATAFGKYIFIWEYNKLGDYDAYIFPRDHISFFDENEFEITIFQNYTVAMRK